MEGRSFAIAKRIWARDWNTRFAGQLNNWRKILNRDRIWHATSSTAEALVFGVHRKSRGVDARALIQWIYLTHRMECGWGGIDAA